RAISGIERVEGALRLGKQGSPYQSSKRWVRPKALMPDLVAILGIQGKHAIIGRQIDEIALCFRVWLQHGEIRIGFFPALAAVAGVQRLKLHSKLFFVSAAPLSNIDNIPLHKD